MNLVDTDANPIPPGAVSGTIQTRDGITLRFARWPSRNGRRRGTVCIVHGRNEWIEKYFETIAELQERGFAVATFDWRSQGGSDRLSKSGRCHVESFADYDHDLDALMREVVLPDCPAPYFALSHSMGSLACLRAARDRRVRFERMVLLAPMLSLSRTASPRMGTVRAITGFFLFFGLDHRPVSRRPWTRWRRLDAEAAPRQLRSAAILEKAPWLRTGIPTVRWLYMACLAMKEARSPKFAASIGIPSLLIAAGGDNVVANEAIEQLSPALRTGAHITIPGARHEVLMDRDPIRRMFWAAFDAFIPGSGSEAAPGSAGQNAENPIV